MPPAEITNAYTNALHAFCLLIYFCAAVRHRRLGHPDFNRSLVAFFFILFALKLMGVYVHYLPRSEVVNVVWAAIAVIVNLMNVVLLRGIGAGTAFTTAAAAVSISATIAFGFARDFMFIALPEGVIGLSAAYLCRGMLRWGFVAVVVWIGARKITAVVLSGELPTEFRYDNDIYHFLLIISTFLIYKGIARGDLAAATEKATIPAASSA